jgi:hypothetical protein
MQLSFGSGAIWGERTDVIGSGIGPRQFGVLQDIQIDFDWSDKELYGQLQFPVAKFAQILGLLYSDIFFGVTPATGQFAVSQLEAATVPATTPYTVIPANAASYNDDLGISYAATGKRFNRVSTPSTAGQYSVNFATGAYVFSSADAGAAILISYTYNVATSGNRLTLANQPMGITPTFKATFYTAYNGSGTALRLNACTANKLSLPTKLDTWTISELDFMAFADASGTIGYLSTVE